MEQTEVLVQQPTWWSIYLNLSATLIYICVHKYTFPSANFKKILHKTQMRPEKAIAANCCPFIGLLKPYLADLKKKNKNKKENYNNKQVNK